VSVPARALLARSGLAERVAIEPTLAAAIRHPPG
jgi:hypothetical protein